MRNFKFIIILASLFAACNQSESPTTNPCSQSSSPSILNLINPSKFEFALEVCRSATKQYGFTQDNQLFDLLFKQDQNLAAFKTGFSQESQSYKQKGFDGYVDDLFTRSKVSSDLKNYLLNYKIDVLSFLQSHPTIEQFTTYTTAKLALLSSLSLCANEIKLVKLLLNQNQGFAQYYYNHHLIDNASRGCSFWEGIGCGLLGGVVGITVGLTTGVLVAISNFAYNDEVVDQENKTNFSILVAVAVATFVSVNIYRWCCPDDEVVVKCAPPSGAYILTHDCNDFTYTVVGPGNYITTNWTNINTDPAAAITPTPSLRIRVPNLATESRMKATIACVDPTGVTMHIWDRQATFGTSANAAPPIMQWGQNPPATAQTNTSYGISVTTGSSGQYSLAWSVSPFGGTVSSTGSWSGTLSFFTPGTKTVTATLTNTCTGQSTSLSQTVTVY